MKWVITLYNMENGYGFNCERVNTNYIFYPDAKLILNKFFVCFVQIINKIDFFKFNNKTFYDIILYFF